MKTKKLPCFVENTVVVDWRLGAGNFRSIAFLMIFLNISHANLNIVMYASASRP